MTSLRIRGILVTCLWCHALSFPVKNRLQQGVRCSPVFQANGDDRDSDVEFLGSNGDGIVGLANGDIPIEDKQDSNGGSGILEVGSLFANSLTAAERVGIDEVNMQRIKTRICDERSYARPSSFTFESLQEPPTLDDLLPMPVTWQERFYTTIPARILTFAVSYFAFPYLAQSIDRIVDLPPEQLNDIVSKFVPGVSILYGTMISLTLSLLYNRQRDIQECAARETALLSIVFRNLVSLFKNDRDLMVEAGNCVSDQVRSLVRKNRGVELMGIIYSDPYARIVDLIDAEEERIAKRNGNFMRKGPLLSNCRDLLNQLTDIRSKRLSHEANGLVPTHFQILNFLTFLILLGYIFSVLPTLDELGQPSNDTSLLFGVLTAIYVLFAQFASDLNEPFFGVYQLRRSSSAVHLLSIKWVMSNHPWLKNVIDYEDCCIGEGADGVRLRSPSLGEMYFDKQKFDVFPLGDEQESI